MKNILSLTPTLPESPRSLAGILPWSLSLSGAIQTIYRTLADRTEDMISENTLALRPAAKGTKRLYFASDLKIVYYDDGSWNGPRHEVVATADLPAAGASQNGRLIIEDAGGGTIKLVGYAAGVRFRFTGASF